MMLSSDSEELKIMIAESFGRSAAQYDQFAVIQQQAGQALLNLLAVRANTFPENTVVADVGCGTGYFTSKLLVACRAKKVVGVDFSEGMLKFSAEKYREEKNIEWLCGDAENLPLPDHSVDIIYANFSLQWCHNIPQLMNQFHRVLKQGGWVCFNSLGSQTLSELRNAWQTVDDYQHVNLFADHDIWRQAATEKFSIIHHSECPQVDYFDSVSALLHSLKSIGANIVTQPNRQKSLMGKRHFQQLMSAYETYRQPAGLPVTYDINQWLLRKNKGDK